MGKLLHEVSSIADQLHKLTDAVSKFEKCKACKKKYYKSVDDADVSFEYKLPEYWSNTTSLSPTSTKSLQHEQPTSYIFFNPFMTKEPIAKAL